MTIPLGSGLEGLCCSFLDEVALGLQPKYRLVERVSTQPEVAGDPVFRDIWDLPQLITFPTTAATLIITSTDAQDSAAGTGMRTVLVEALDAEGNLRFDVITLNGLGQAFSPVPYLRCNWSFGQTTGSNQTNAGDITATIGGNPQWFIATGIGRSAGYFYTTPLNCTALISDSIFLWGLNQDLLLRCLVNAGGVNTVVLRTSFDRSTSGETLNPRIPMPALTDTHCTVTREDGLTGGEFGFIGKFLEYCPTGYKRLGTFFD